MSSLRATSMGVMRPPKPPCWRDFVISAPRSTNSDGLDSTEQSGRTVCARAPVPDVIDTSKIAASLPGNKPSRLTRRPRAKIHRTRSEHVIHPDDLPDSAFTATLANTDPKGVRVRTADGRLYVEENNRRCQNWLASIEAAEPLDKVDYTATEHQTVSSKVDQTPNSARDNQISVLPSETWPVISGQNDNYLIPLYELQQGVDVEIPEETFVWSSSMNPRHKSPSSGEDFCSPSRDVSRKEGSHTLSGNPQTPQSASPALSTSVLIDNTSKTPCCAEYSKCENSCGHCSAKTSKCGKVSRGKKLYKLCCDNEDQRSSSCRENGCHGYQINANDVSKLKINRDQVNEDVLSPLEPRTRSNVRCCKSLSRQAFVGKMFTESDLTDVKQSTLD